MDYYDLYEDSLNEQHDYNVCMANCPDGKDCGCNGGELPPMTILAIFSPFIIIAIIIIVAKIIKAIRDNKDKKEYKEYQRRKQLGDTKWVKEYERRREQAFYGKTQKSKKGKGEV